MLSAREVLRWINGFAVAADFEVQKRPLSRPGTHSRDPLPEFDSLAFGDQQCFIVPVGTEIIRIVFDDHELPVTGQPSASVYDLATRGSADILTFSTTDLDSRLSIGRRAVARDHRTTRRPLPIGRRWRRFGHTGSSGR